MLGFILSLRVQSSCWFPVSFQRLHAQLGVAMGRGSVTDPCCTFVSNAQVALQSATEKATR